MSRNYSSIAQTMILQGVAAAASGTLQLDTLDGLPAAPFTLVLDPDTLAEEIVTVTAVDAGTLTVTVDRGEDGTTAKNHSAGAVVRHMSSARDFAEAFAASDANALAITQHTGRTTAVHGIADTAALLTGSNVATVTNKVIDADDNTITGLGDAEIDGLSGSKISGTVASATNSATVGGIKVFVQSATPSHSGSAGSAFWIKF